MCVKNGNSKQKNTRFFCSFVCPEVFVFFLVPLFPISGRHWCFFFFSFLFHWVCVCNDSELSNLSAEYTNKWDSPCPPVQLLPFADIMLLYREFLPTTPPAAWRLLKLSTSQNFHCSHQASCNQVSCWQWRCYKAFLFTISNKYKCFFFLKSSGRNTQTQSFSFFSTQSTSLKTFVL